MKSLPVARRWDTVSFEANFCRPSLEADVVNLSIVCAQLSIKKYHTSLTKMLVSQGLSQSRRLAVAKPLKIARNSSQSYNSFGANRSRPERPVSPHVTIYDFPLPAITSILHRVTGVGLAVGKFFFCCHWFLILLGLTVVGAGVIINPALAGGLVAFVKSYPALHFVTKFGVGYAGIYHTLQGFRHLVLVPLLYSE